MNLKNKRLKREKKQAPLWMVTYSDMVTLILVFFILLFSMSQIDAEKLKTVTESYQQRVIFDFYSSPVPMDQASNIEDQKDESEDLADGGLDEGAGQNDMAEVTEPDQLQNLLEEIERYLESEGLAEVIKANRTERGVVLVLQENVLFESARAELKEEALPFLDKVGTLLDNIPNFVKVEGHTDTRPINTLQFPSNWELSGARASSVVRYFTEENGLDPVRFQIAGYADTRPVAPNDTSENMQLNRRVEIVILDTDN
ncbi:flagellar motor protein MotS [Tenuibacillus multivorans]|uniref:Chemotaxis protein MotB n=1 Tax=Tenuibacillus multivorans TaxID=237069 RepID=A0A1H0EF23_9BACI|nr:flagellar motor protein MotS [Tenuibacillus multivorans]GEL77180.1 OmpA/MotB protein [Tenuibacillus multivorans]SDN81097.1 chemotaxis protein MotB [Tenuibacillus multivorans]